MEGSGTITVLLVDSSPLVRVGLGQLLKDLANVEVVGEASNGPQALEAALTFRPRLVLVRKELARLDGIAVTREIKRSLPDTRVIMLLKQESDLWAALESEADGYLVRETSREVIQAVIRFVINLGPCLGPTIARYLLHGDGLPLLRGVAVKRGEIPALKLLSAREKDVLRLLMDGLSNEQIAGRLKLKTETVKVHVKNILRKLNARHRTDVVVKVLRSGEFQTALASES